MTIELDALATRVIFDDRQRAIGVEYLKGERLYRAHASPNAAPGVLRQVFASREIILSGGAFNTPQLLMLSGIGRREELARHGIDLRVELPGVGRNLQDRYEVSVVERMREDWAPLAERALIKRTANTPPGRRTKAASIRRTDRPWSSRQSPARRARCRIYFVSHCWRTFMVIFPGILT